MNNPEKLTDEQRVNKILKSYLVFEHNGNTQVTAVLVLLADDFIKLLSTVRKEAILEIIDLIENKGTHLAAFRNMRAIDLVGMIRSLIHEGVK